MENLHWRLVGGDHVIHPSTRDVCYLFSGTELDHNTPRRCIYHIIHMSGTHALAKEVAAVSGWLATADAICTNLKLPGASWPHAPRPVS